ncbi:DUF4389 domain-containing protein [Marinimicrobium agarilyticum]|uniref:DUF4389 domain-containing protein n=1 Tax=Marinimicrobium agarilyticum TaxID=306546 RepID=UPI0003F787E9|nr:DUF4389 domain-containing protein [Marinimicrobium agarilyticum]
MDTESVKTNITSGEHWLRLVYMLLFAVLLYVAGFVMGFIIVLQFLFALLSGSANKNLRQFGESLALYIYRVLQFLTYSREDKPFPFSDWPEPEEQVVATKTRPTPRRKTTPKAKTATKAPDEKPGATDKDDTQPS